MRNLTILSVVLFIGCTAAEPQPTAESLTGFRAVEYKALSSLRFGPRDTAQYLFDEVCDSDLHSSIACTTSDGAVGSQEPLTFYRFYQLYHGVPVWGTKIELVYNTKTLITERAALLVVDPIRLKTVPECTVPVEQALQKIEELFLAADNAETYDITEPSNVYFHNKQTNQWHLGWGCTILAHHSGYDQHSKELVMVTLTYSIIIDGITGDQLLLEFNMGR